MSTPRQSTDILLLGCDSVGKTLLVKQLQHHTTTPDEPPIVVDTQPTNGVDLSEIRLKKERWSIRELGGSFSPVWPKYFASTKSVVFVIDTSHPTQVSASCMELFQVLRAQDLANKPLLILFNKTDVPSRLTRTQLFELMRLDTFLMREPERIKVLEVSALRADGLDAVIEWFRWSRGRTFGGDGGSTAPGGSSDTGAAAAAAAADPPSATPQRK